MAETTIKEPTGSEAKPPAAPPAARAEGRHPMLALRDEIDRLFDSFLGGFSWAPWRRGLPPAEPWAAFRTALDTSFPAVDVAEREGAYRITAELPGMSEKDLEVGLAGDRLTIRGEKRQESEETKEGYYLAERRYGSFQRSFAVPEDADPERIEASFKDGVLAITLPKRPEAQAQRKTIAVKAG